MKNVQQIFKQRKWIILGVVGLLVIAAVGLWFWREQMLKNSTLAASSYQTTRVVRGNISISVTGSGSLKSLQTTDLSFPVSGTVGAVNVTVGSVVKKGDVLATLSNLEALQLSVSNYELSVQTAQKKLDDLKNGGDAALAQALVDQSTAEKAYQDAQANLHTRGEGRCEKNKTETYYYQYMDLKNQAAVWQGYLDNGSGYGYDFIMEHLQPLAKQRDAAYYNWKYCETYTDEEIADSQAALDLSKANVDAATKKYQTLKDNHGVDPKEVEMAQAELTNAQLQLTKAQNNLAGATMLAPMDGTITVVNGAAGENVSGGTFISMADLSDPVVLAHFDQEDYQNLAVGCPASVTLSNNETHSFEGKVTSIAPQLVEVQSVSSLESYVDFDKDATVAGKTLPLGLRASVEVVCQKAEDVLEVPTQAIYEDGNTKYVYVLNLLGVPEKRVVEIGLEATAFSEVKSGLNEGDRVITTPVH
jgi:HlyD family secretion protein